MCSAIDFAEVGVEGEFAIEVEANSDGVTSRFGIGVQEIGDGDCASN